MEIEQRKVVAKKVGLRLFKSIAIAAIVIAATNIIGCRSAKSLRYFNNISDSQLVKLPDIPKPRHLIMPDDMLEIKIGGANEVTTALLNSYSSSLSNVNNITGYLVDYNGYVEFPSPLGRVKAEGLTIEQFKDTLREKVSKVLKDPLVTARFINFRFTVLGEVRTPGTFSVQNQRITILEALGQAGDMTTYARRNTVRVIRDSSGQREVGMLNFNDKAVFTSPYYYLHRNDVVYVEADKTKSQIEDYSRVGSILATVASLIAITITIFR